MRQFSVVVISCLVAHNSAQRQSFNSDSRFSNNRRPGPVTTSNSGIRQFDFQYYDYDPLPSGPTRPPGKDREQAQFDAAYDDYYYDYYDEDPLPSGPTREPPLPSGPTRRPDQPTRLPPAPQVVGVPKDVYSSLPLLTTRRPPTETPRANVNFRIPPPRFQNSEPVFELPRRPDEAPRPHRGPGRRPDFKSSGLFVTSDLDILSQTKLFTRMDPNQEQFIKAPKLNAGALPLAFEAPDSHANPFFPPLPPLLDGP